MTISIFGQNLPLTQTLIAIGILLAVAEVFVPGFVLFPIGLGFLLTAAVSPWIDSTLGVLLALGVSEVLLFALFFRKLRIRRSSPPTAIDALIGTECEVTESIPARGRGYVKVYGDRWQARTLSGEALDVGQRATIRSIDGNQVVIEPRA